MSHYNSQQYMLIFCIHNTYINKPPKDEGSFNLIYRLSNAAAGAQCYSQDWIINKTVSGCFHILIGSQISSSKFGLAKKMYARRVA